MNDTKKDNPNEFEKKCRMEFDTLRMHKPYNIVCMCTLSMTFEYVIKHLTSFTKQFNNLIAKSINDKYKKTIICHFDDLIFNNKHANPNSKDTILENAKETCINNINTFENQSFNERNIMSLQYNNFDYKEHHKKLYEHILENLSISIAQTNDFESKINIIKIETDKMIDRIVAINLNNMLSNIIELHLENENELKEIVVDKGIGFIFNLITNPKELSNLFVNKYEINLIGSRLPSLKATAKKKIVDIPIENIIANKTYNRNIRNILYNTIKLKGMLINAEQKAFELTEIIKAYNNS